MFLRNVRLLILSKSKHILQQPQHQRIFFILIICLDLIILQITSIHFNTQWMKISRIKSMSLNITHDKKIVIYLKIMIYLPYLWLRVHFLTSKLNNRFKWEFERNKLWVLYSCNFFVSVFFYPSSSNDRKSCQTIWIFKLLSISWSLENANYWYYQSISD